MKLDLHSEINLTKPVLTGFDTGNIDSAYEFASKIALGHYENFPVGSILIRKDLRKHFFAIYAFSRIADDLADEPDRIFSDDLRIQALDDFLGLIDFEGELRNPVFLALRNTCEKFDLPLETFAKLIVAFKRDVMFRQADTFDDLIDYCTYSANPVGELILRLYGLYNPLTAPLSDAVCTGLQLVNFWQDFTRDLPNDRCFVPVNLLKKYNLTNSDLSNPKKSVILAELIAELCQTTQTYFDKGENLIKHLTDKRLRAEIKAVIAGGRLTNKKIGKLADRVFAVRPSLSKLETFGILIKSMF